MLDLWFGEGAVGDGGFQLVDGHPAPVDGLAILEDDAVGIDFRVIDVAVDEGGGDADGFDVEKVLTVAIHAGFLAHLAGSADAAFLAGKNGTAGVFPLVGADELLRMALCEQDARRSWIVQTPMMV